MYSKVLNLHQPKGELPSKCKIIIVTLILQHSFVFAFSVAATLPASSLQSLQEWGKTHHSYLFQKTLAKSQSKENLNRYVVLWGVRSCHFVEAVYYRSSDELGVDSLIHFRAKVLATPTSRGTYMYSIHVRVLKFTVITPLSSYLTAAVVLSDRAGKEVILYL